MKRCGTQEPMGFAETVSGEPTLIFKIWVLVGFRFRPNLFCAEPWLWSYRVQIFAVTTPPNFSYCFVIKLIFNAVTRGRHKKFWSEPGSHQNPLFGFRPSTRNPLRPNLPGTRKPPKPIFLKWGWVPPRIPEPIATPVCYSIIYVTLALEEN